jgi:hypothetical protein
VTELRLQGIRCVNIDSSHSKENMSWNDVHKLKPQKPKPDSKQSLASTEFLVWDTQFALSNQSNEPLVTLSQDTFFIDDTALSQLSDIPEA